MLARQLDIESFNEGLETGARLCENVANATIESMSEDGRSDTWKIIAQQSVEQYQSIAKNLRKLKRPLDNIPQQE